MEKQAAPRCGCSSRLRCRKRSKTKWKRRRRNCARAAGNLRPLDPARTIPPDAEVPGRRGRRPRVAALVEAVRAACRGFAALQLRAERIGFFPDLRHPRVVWAGVRDEAAQLPRLQQAVERDIEGFTAECRSRGSLPATSRSAASRASGAPRQKPSPGGGGHGGRLFGQWPACEMELMRERALAQGAPQILATIALAQDTR